MADKCNIHRGCGGRYRNNTDLFGIDDTDVNRKVYPERNLPCEEHYSDIVDRRPAWDCRGRDNDRVGGIVTDRCFSSSDRLGGTSDRFGGTSDRRGRRNNRNCLCKIIHCLCGRRRHRRDCSSS
ncbi:MAG: hypothetical protein ACYCWE_06030 [Eubacteriales bacterium]